MKLFCKSANQNKTNFRFTTLKKQTGFGKIEENMDLSRIHLAALINFTKIPLGNFSVTKHES